MNAVANSFMRALVRFAAAILALGLTGAGATEQSAASRPVRVIRRSAAGAHLVAPAMELPQVATLVADSDVKEVTVRPGTAEAHFAFEIMNISTGEVTVTGVQTTCGCTVVQGPSLPWHLAAGTSGPIAVTMNVVGRSGTVAKTVLVQTDRGVKTLIVRARIEPAPKAPDAIAASGR